MQLPHGLAIDLAEPAADFGSNITQKWLRPRGQPPSKSSRDVTSKSSIALGATKAMWSMTSKCLDFCQQLDVFMASLGTETNSLEQTSRAKVLKAFRSAGANIEICRSKLGPWHKHRSNFFQMIFWIFNFHPGKVDQPFHVSNLECRKPTWKLMVT